MLEQHNVFMCDKALLGGEGGGGGGMGRSRGEVEIRLSQRLSWRERSIIR